MFFLGAAALLAFSACNSTKYNSSNKPVSLQDTYWKLIELNGQPVTDAGAHKEIYLTLNAKDNHAGGNGGCNGYGGSYELNPNGFNIKFGNFIRTQMACAGLDIENQYLKVFEMADSYYVTKDTLQLNRARMAPLAKFVAVPGKEIK